MIIAKRFEISIAYILEDKGIIGSNLSITFAFEGELCAETGMVIDISFLKKKISQKLDMFDHHCLCSTFKHKNDAFRYLIDELWSIITQTEIDGLTMHHITISEELSFGVTKDNHGYWFSSPYYFSGSRLLSINDPYTLEDILVNPIQIKAISFGVPFLQLEREISLFGLPLDINKICSISEVVSRNNLVIKWELIGGLIEIFVDNKEIFLTVSKYFDFSHRLNNIYWDSEKNNEVFGKCNGLHGHRYQLSVTISTSKDMFTINANNLRGILEQLTESLVFSEGLITTGENLLQYFKCKLNNLLNENLILIRLKETPNNIFYFLAQEKDGFAYD